MKLDEKRRAVLLGGALLLTLVAVAATRDDDPPPVEKRAPARTAAISEPPARRPAAPEALPPVERLRLDLLDRPPSERPVQDLFAAKSWVPPPPPPPPPPKPAPPPPPPPPTAPPLPFTFMGKLQEDEQPWIVYLVRGERVYSVREGDVIDGTYRVGPLQGGQLTLTYLPLEIPQFLAVGASS